MAVIPPVTSGTVARASEQNALITQVNTNTTGLASGESRITALETKPRVVLRKNADQTITSGSNPAPADKIVTWQTASGTTSMKSGDTVVIPTAGAYLLTANVNMIGGGTVVADCVIYIVKNSTTDVANASLAAFAQPGTLSTAGVGNGLSTSVVADLAQGDVLRVLVYQGSGASRNLRPSTFGGCSFTVTKL